MKRGKPTFAQFLDKHYDLSYYEFKWKLNYDERKDIEKEYKKRYGQIRWY